MRADTKEECVGICHGAGYAQISLQLLKVYNYQKSREKTRQRKKKNKTENNTEGKNREQLYAIL